jgi:hypothetical protein
LSERRNVLAFPFPKTASNVVKENTQAFLIGSFWCLSNRVVLTQVQSRSSSAGFQVEMIMSVSTAIMAIASAVAGTFGMNIPFMYNERAGSYKWVSVATVRKF